MLDLSVGIIVTTTSEKLFAVSRPLIAYNLKHNYKNSNKKIFLLLCFFALVNSHFLFSHSITKYLDNQRFDDILGNYVNENLNQSSSLKNSNQTSTYDDDEYLGYDSQIFENIISESNKNICTYIKWNKFYEDYWTYIDAIIYSFLPFVLLSMFNLLIISYLKKAKNEGLKFKLHYRTSVISKSSRNETIRMTKKYDSIENENNKKLIISIEYKKQNLKYTIRHLASLIVLTNISFCVLSMPMVILQIMHHLNKEKYNRKDKVYDLLKAIAEIFQYLNHSSNFFFYCLGAKSFRNELKIFIQKLFTLFKTIFH